MRSTYDPVPGSLPLSRRSVSWKVLAEPAALLGGGRAVLLQVAHPKVGAGVEQHSGYARDPSARLFRTVDVMAKLSFASPEVSARQARLLERVHRRVVGTTDDGQPYEALDPSPGLGLGHPRRHRAAHVRAGSSRPSPEPSATSTTRTGSSSPRWFAPPPS